MTVFAALLVRSWKHGGDMAEARWKIGMICVALLIFRLSVKVFGT